MQGFWLELACGTLKTVRLICSKLAHKLRALNIASVARRRASFVYNYLRQPHTLHIKIKHFTLKLTVVLLLILLLWPHPKKTIYADPAPVPFGASVRLSKARPLPDTTLVPQPAVAVPVPPPPPPAPMYVAPTPVYGCGSDPSMVFIYQHESGCNTGAINPIGACGLGQALPCSKMGCSLSDWNCQNNFFIGYAIRTYGSTYNAYLFWIGHSWW